MKERPDLETTGAAIIRDYFVKQTPDADAPVLLGVIDATAVWKDGQLTVISEWSIWAETARRNEFFSRLPGVTTYDLVRSAVLGVAL
jgi:hypothetical protein